MLKPLPKLSGTQIVLAVTAIAVVYFLVAGGLNTVRSHQLRQEETRLRSDIGELQQRYHRLEALRDYLNSDEYLESVAREQLGLAREGEVNFVVVSTVPSPTPEPGAEGAAGELWWEVLIR